VSEVTSTAITGVCSTHAYADLNFPGKASREEDKQLKFIIADIFLCRFVVNLLAANLVFIAPSAEIFLWVRG
jgi:hypothetical protein